MKKFLSVLLCVVSMLSSVVLPVEAKEIADDGGIVPMAAVTMDLYTVIPLSPVVGERAAAHVRITVPLGSPTPTGTVTITDLPSGRRCTTTSLELLPPDGISQRFHAYCSLIFNSAGAHTLEAQYTGDLAYEEVVMDQFVATVSKALTIITSFAIEGTPAFGQTLTASVAGQAQAPGGGDPTGVVNIVDAQNTTVLCSFTNFQGGRGVCSFTAGFVGARDVTAVYAGDGNYEGSTSSVLSINVSKTTPVISLTSDPASPVVGQAVVFTVTAASVLGQVPTGRASVRDMTGTGGTCGGFTLVNGSGTCQMAFTYADTKTLTAHYVGDSYYLVTDKAVPNFVVGRAGSTPVIVSTTPSPSLPAESLTVNFQVSAQAPGSGTPTGSVIIRDDGVTLCSAILPATSCTGAILGAGEHVLTAEYAGDSNFLPGQSVAYPHLVSLGDTYADPGGLCAGNKPCFRSIQAAIQAAAVGRTVTVYSGTYHENVNVNKVVTVTLGQFVTVNGSLTIAAGNLIGAVGSLAVSGDVFETGGVFNPNGGEIRLFGPAAQQLSMHTVLGVLSMDKAGPTGYWPFEEGQGAAISDASPNHLAGSLVNGLANNASFTAQGVPALNYQNLFALQTNPGYVSIPSHEALDLSSSFSLVAWAYWNGTGEPSQVLLSRPYADGVTQQTGLALGITGGMPVLSIFDGSALRSLSANQPIPVNQWFHFAASYDGQVARIFLNGQEVAMNDYGSVQPLATGDTPFLIGREFETGLAGRAWNGQVDEVQVYAQALAPVEIVLLNRGEKPDNTVTLEQPLNVHHLFLDSGTLDVSSSNYGINVSGNWRRGNGHFIARQSTVTLNGSDQAIFGENTFYNLARHTYGRLTFPSGRSQTITGALDLRGAAGSPLTLASDIPGAHWNIDPQGSRDFSDVSVGDSANINPLRIDATQNNVISLGNNTGWDFYAPTVLPLSDSAIEDQEKLLSLQASDGDGDALTLSVTSLPAHGRLYQVSGGVRGNEITAADLPAAVTDAQRRLMYCFTLEGPNQVTFNVQVSDGLLTGSATVSLSLTNVNDPPMLSAIPDQTMIENASLGPLFFTVFDEETLDLNTLTVFAESSNSSLIPASGLSLGGSGANRSLSISPASGMDGVANITLTVRDEANQPAARTFTVTVRPVNDPPLGANQTVTMAEDTHYIFQTSDFTFVDTHQDTFGGILVTSLVSAGRLTEPQGVIEVGPNTLVLDLTSLMFTPAANAYGSPYASFTFRVRDSSGAFSVDSYTMTIHVTPVPDAPVAHDDVYTTLEDTPITINPLQNDTDADNDPLSFIPVTQPALGHLTPNPDGSLTYTPSLNANGDDTFTYRASDGVLTSEAATVTIHIIPVDDPPVLTIVPIPPANEGDRVVLTATYIDPDTGQDALQPGDSLEWDFGDGSGWVTGGLSVSHVYPDNGSFQVQARISRLPLTSVASLPVTIANVVPQVLAGGNASVLSGQRFTRMITFTDPGADVWTATVDFGDGGGPQPLALDGHAAVLQHVFTGKGVWTVTVTVDDGDGGVGSAAFQVTVEEKRLVFLPVAVR